VAETEVMRIGSFAFRVNPNSVRWSYKMNVTQTDTKGGRVFQLLSCSIDDITVEGEFAGGYDEMRRFEQFFIYVVGYQAEYGAPQRLKYAKRGWDFPVYVHSFPTVQYSLETVVPTYSITLVPKDAETGKLVTATKIAELAKLADGVQWQKSIYNSPDLDPQGTSLLQQAVMGEFSAMNAGLTTQPSSGVDTSTSTSTVVAIGNGLKFDSKTGIVSGNTPATAHFRKMA
jgi:hypothetical protein